MNSLAVRLLGAVSFLAVAPLAGANLILNGSFETPSVPVAAFTTFPVGSSALTEWLVFGPSGAAVSVVSGSFTQNGVTGNAQDGSQWLDLTGNGHNTTEGVSQSVATTVGNQYQLSYYIGNTTGGGIFGSTSTVTVLLDDIVTFTDTNSTISPSNLNWVQFSHTFVASGATTMLGFRNGDPANDNSNGLDNVVLLDLGTPVPEPVTLALLSFALAGLGFARRRKLH